MEIYDTFVDLAPMIVRRRLIIEGTLNALPSQESISEYMKDLSNVMNMTIVSQPSFNYEEEYGLAAYMQTGSKERADRVARQLRAGAVHVNGAGYNYGSPFGGYKQSGNGREGGDMGIEDYLETKTLHFSS